MKERPILFSTEMVQAVLAGRKTETRRVMKVQPPSDEHKFLTLLDSTSSKDTKNRYKHTWGLKENKYSLKSIADKYFSNPYGLKGDTLWVRETWARTEWLHPSDPNYGYIYKASENGKDWEDNSEEWKWKPSIHMPKDATRIWLEVVEVKTERVQDITKESIIAEGVQVPMHNGRFQLPLTDPHFPIEYFPNGELPSLPKIYEAFWISLWNGINADRKDKNGTPLNYDWTSNPWVWVVRFRVLSTTDKTKTLAQASACATRNP